jgi:hypothetical protein
VNVIHTRNSPRSASSSGILCELGEVNFTDRKPHALHKNPLRLRRAAIESASSLEQQTRKRGKTKTR